MIFYLILLGAIFGGYKYSNTLYIKYDKLKSLNKLVSTQYKNIFYIFWITFCILVKTMYIHLFQYLNKSIVKIDKNTYEVCYAVNGNLYKILIKVKKGPRTVIQATDENDNDITQMMNAYLGPSENFHNSLFTPDFFGKESITFNLYSGNDISFTRFEVMKLN